MEITNLVVARYVDGRVVKGMTQDFSPNRGLFHVEPLDGGPPVEVRIRQLKALFFVVSLQGDPSRPDVHGFVHGPAETQQGKKIAVRFKDGELLCGYTLTWTPEREGFFMFPADSTANNQRMFVVTAATLEVKAGPAAEVLAQRVLSERATPGGEGGAHGGPAGGIHRMPPIGGRRPSGFLPRPSRGAGPERRSGTD